jgi:hypothetical protein
MNINIIDNFLNKSYHKEILDLTNGPHFPWYYQEDITGIKNDSLFNFGFNHTIIDSNGPRFTNYYYLILPFLLKVKDLVTAKKILRCRFDMTVNCFSKYVHNKHTDYDFKNIATVYYVNDTDGDTVFYSKKNKKLNQRQIDY